MKLSLVRDIAKRTPHNLDIVFQFIFGGNPPILFDTTKTYVIGDMTYVVDEIGNLTIWRCKQSGQYTEPSEPYWEVWDMETKFPSLKYPYITEHSTLYNISVSSEGYKIPESTTGEDFTSHSFVEVYSDGEFVNSSEYVITDGVIVPNESLSNVFIVRYDPVNTTGCIIEKVCCKGTRLTDTTIELPTIPNYSWNIIAYDVFVDGIKIDTDDVSVLDDCITVKNKTITEENDIILNCWVSRINRASIVQTQLTFNMNTERDIFRIDLTPYTLESNLYTIEVYEDGKRVNPSYYEIDYGVIHLNNIEHYFSVGSTITVIVTYIFDDATYAVGQENGKRRNAIQYNNRNDEAKCWPVPIVNYNPQEDDFLLFAHDGAYITPARWYMTKDNMLHFYDHTTHIDAYSILDFHIIDRWDEIHMDRCTLVLDEDHQKSFTIPKNSDDYNGYMLFTTTGAYLSADYFTWSGNTLTFKDTYTNPMLRYEALELVVISGTPSKNMVKRFILTESAPDVFTIPRDQIIINQTNMSLLVFTSDGIYVGEDMYTVNGNNIILNGSSPTSNGSKLEVIVLI